MLALMCSFADPICSICGVCGPETTAGTGMLRSRQSYLWAALYPQLSSDGEALLARDLFRLGVES